MQNTIAETVLFTLLGLLVLCGIFFTLEKPLRHRYICWSNKRFQHRTGIDPNEFPNPFG